MLGAPALADGVSLFTTDAGAPTVNVAETQLAPDARQRVARLDREGLGALREEIRAGRPARLRLNLFHDVEYEASLERSARTTSGYSLSGPLDGVPLGRVVLVVGDSLTLGRIYTPQGAWSTHAAGEVATVEPLPRSVQRCEALRAPAVTAHPEDGMRSGFALRTDGGKTAPRAAAEPPPVGSGGRHGVPVADDDDAMATGDGNVVDVLVVYPSFARDLEGGYERMLSLIELDFATANASYAASGVDLRIELAAAVEVEYDRFVDTALGGRGVDQAWSEALEHLTARDDGHLDVVHRLRDRHGADLVLLHLGGKPFQRLFDSYIGGIAWTMPLVSRQTLEEHGFSVASSGDGTFVAHELGHSMGLHHDRGNNTLNEPFPYSHGFHYRIPDKRSGRLNDYGTIMSQYSDVPTTESEFVLAFSNPDLVHPNYPDLRLGVPGDEPSDAADGPANASRHLNALRVVLSNVRGRAIADSCRYELTGSQAPLPSAGGTYRVRVETQAHCPWMARGGDWVSSVLDAEGMGSGDIRYEVGANDGFRRPVEVVVAGRSHSRPQTGSASITPVCARSAAIRNALMFQHADYPEVVHDGIRCENFEFDAAFLAGVRSLGWAQELELQPGDLDGLSGLEELGLPTGRLPTNIFSGLIGLRNLWLSKARFGEEPSELRELVPGVFRGASGLRKLTIWGHRIDVLRPGTFEGLPRLLDLEVNGAGESGVFDEPSNRPSTRLAPGAFHGMSELRRLRFQWHAMGPLEAGAFDGLTNLKRLHLHDNALPSITAGAFRGLGRLTELDLRENGLKRLSGGVLEGLTRLEHLDLFDNRLATLEPGAFRHLPHLTGLILWQNRLERLPPGAFEGLTRLEYLSLSGNRLTELAPGGFSGLPSLRDLNLQNNRLRDLPAGVFRGLESLYGLALRHNDLGTLRAGTFDGLANLDHLYLERTNLATLEPGVFDGLARLDVLELDQNRLRRLAPGTLRGLDLAGLILHGNPGAPFTFAPTPVLLPEPHGAVEGEGLRVTVDSAPEAPFRMTAVLSAAGGTFVGSATPSRARLRIEAGESRSGYLAQVVPDGDGPVTVRIDQVEWENRRRPPPPPPSGGGISLYIDFQRYYTSLGVAPGNPLVLYGFPDIGLTRGQGPAVFDLAQVFSFYLGTATDIAASSGDPAIATVSVRDGSLVVSPRGTGTVRVTVTATGADGAAVTRSFVVNVRVPSVPLLLSAGHYGREGFVRVINHTDKADTVHITAIDDAGNPHGPVRLRLRPYGAAQFNSTDLEQGNEAKRLLEGVGVGEGDWRLEFESDLDIEALSYVRTGDGFLTPIHDAAPFADGVHRIPTFNPASNVRQSSRLRVINTGREEAEVTVRGVDDSGASPGGPVRFSVPAGAARELDAMQLEAGDMALDGAIGDGEGKWRLAVESESPVVAMSLLENTSTGHLTNLSSVPAPPGEDGVHHVAFFPAAGDARGREGFARVINRSQESGVVRIDAFDDAGSVHGPLELTVEAGAAAHFNSEDLEVGASGKGLIGSTGVGAGDWRLELSSDLDIEVLAYVRSDDGFLTAMHDVAEVRDGRHEVALFNPGSNTSQVGLLRLTNTTSNDVTVAVAGTDDSGRAPPRRGVTFVTVPANEALTLTAQELEAGVVSDFFARLEEEETGTIWDESFVGYWGRWPLGDGTGKWRLSLEAKPGVLVQSLVESPTGHLTNLSTAGR